MQINHVDEWLSCLRSTFEAMDTDKDGRLRPSEILDALQAKLPEAEVRLGTVLTGDRHIGAYMQQQLLPAGNALMLLFLDSVCEGPYSWLVHKPATAEHTESTCCTCSRRV